jgi:hypothetical protein
VPFGLLVVLFIFIFNGPCWLEADAEADADVADAEADVADADAPELRRFLGFLVVATGGEGVMVARMDILLLVVVVVVLVVVVDVAVPVPE